MQVGANMRAEVTIMRRFIQVTGLIGLMLFGVRFAAEAQQARGPFGSWGQVWGTFVWRTHVSSAIVIPSLLTLHIDGTVSVSAGDMFGSPTAANRRYITPLHGVWERTGWQSVGGTSLWLISDAATGAIQGWGRARTSLAFSDDFQRIDGRMFTETLLCAAGPPVSCPDPQDPGATWVRNPNMPPEGFSISGTRLVRVPAGPLP